MSLKEEIQKRRTFAIHVTRCWEDYFDEKLLLLVEQSKLLAPVKSNRFDTATKSDWWPLRSRENLCCHFRDGASNTKGWKFNLLEYACHQDFRRRYLPNFDGCRFCDYGHWIAVKAWRFRRRNLWKSAGMRNTPWSALSTKSWIERKRSVWAFEEVDAEAQYPVHPLSWPIAWGKKLQRRV